MTTVRDPCQSQKRTNWWVRFHHRRWYIRQPVKWTALALVFLAVTFPYPDVLLRHLRHLGDPNALIDADSPGLDQLMQDLKPQITPHTDASATLNIVQRYVQKRIPYAWDWDTWGVADYLPTVAEVLHAGREDCDGRAVIAASLLAKLGFEARLVADGAHVWVWTPSGETMGPHAIRTFEATPEGFIIHWQGLKIIPKTLAYGIAVFPLLRELILIAAIWLLLISPRLGWARITATAGMLVLSLTLIRLGGRFFQDPVYWMLGTGLILLLGAIGTCLLGRRIERSSARVIDSSPAARPRAIESSTVPQE